MVEEKRIRLMKLLEHWAEHNDEHGQRYSESAAEAEALGLKGAAKEMRDAHLKTVAVSRHLRNALASMEAG